MDSYENPVSGPDPYEKYRVDSAGERQRGGPSDEPPKEKGGVAAHLLSLLQKAVDYFLERHTGSKTDGREVQGHLVRLKSFFETMKEEDRSQDADFLNALSKAWNDALEDSLALNEASAHCFKALTKKILHYPENQPHTLGYYLTEYAGQKWVPFPYMELIQKIHSEHEKNPSSSPLSEWVGLLEETIRQLNEK